MIAPSQFGYLGSSLPPGATPADQADALAALLDQLRMASADVPVRCSRAQSPRQLHVRRLLLVPIVGCRRLFGDISGTRLSNA